MSQFPAQPPSSVSESASLPVTSSKATTSLILGIVGFVLSMGSFCLLGLVPPCALFFPVVGALVSLLIGYQAKREITASNGAIQGAGQATVGIVLGWINAGIALIMIILVVLFVAGMLGLGLLGNLQK
jgi:hypothetical protein